MRKKRGDTKKQNGCAIGAEPIETLSEAFHDGCFIEPVHDPADWNTLNLMLFDGESAEIAPRLEHRGRVYAAREVDRSVVRELCLPTELRPREPVRQLLADIVELIQRFSGLPDHHARLLARFPLATWVLKALRVAPYLLFVGPDSRELTQLLALLRCLCRHALELTELSAGGLCSLPMDADLTLLVDQPELSAPAQRILNASQKREPKLPHRGKLWRPFCAKAIHCAGYFQPWAIGAIKIPVIPVSRALPVLDEQELNRIAQGFQPRLLSYRFAVYAKVQAANPDNGICDFATRETVNSLAACTPEDADLQAEIVELAAGQAEEVLAARWTDPSIVLIESLLLSCHTPGEAGPYVGQVSDVMMTISSSRGEERVFKPNQVSRMIRQLGLKLEPRDSQGVKLRLTEAVRRRIHELARNFAVPSIENPVAGCADCAALAEPAASGSDVLNSDSEQPRRSV